MSATFSLVSPSAQVHVDGIGHSPFAVRVVVIGEIDVATAGALRDGLLHALSVPLLHRVEVDLAAVTFMDCGGLGVLVAARNAAVRAGRRLWITNPQPIVRRLLELTELLSALTVMAEPAPPGPAGQPAAVLLAA